MSESNGGTTIHRDNWHFLRRIIALRKLQRPVGRNYRVLDRDLLERGLQLRQPSLPPFERNFSANVIEGPKHWQADSEEAFDKQRVKDFGSELHIDTQTNAESEGFQLHLAVERKVAREMAGVPAQDSASLQPCLHGDPKRTEAPVTVVAYPCPCPELVGAEHE